METVRCSRKVHELALSLNVDCGIETSRSLGIVFLEMGLGLLVVREVYPC